MQCYDNDFYTTKCTSPYSIQVGFQLGKKITELNLRQLSRLKVEGENEVLLFMLLKTKNTVCFFLRKHTNTKLTDNKCSTFSTKDCVGLGQTGCVLIHETHTFICVSGMHVLCSCTKLCINDL